jgi:hypothetical protein
VFADALPLTTPEQPPIKGTCGSTEIKNKNKLQQEGLRLRRIPFLWSRGLVNSMAAFPQGCIIVEGRPRTSTRYTGVRN